MPALAYDVPPHLYLRYAPGIAADLAIVGTPPAPLPEGTLPHLLAEPTLVGGVRYANPHHLLLDLSYAGALWPVELHWIATVYLRELGVPFAAVVLEASAYQHVGQDFRSILASAGLTGRVECMGDTASAVRWLAMQVPGVGATTTPEEVQAALIRGARLEAVARYRAMTGAPLGAAIEVIETFEAALPPAQEAPAPHPAAPPPPPAPEPAAPAPAPAAEARAAVPEGAAAPFATTAEQQPLAPRPRVPPPTNDRPSPTQVAPLPTANPPAPSADSPPAAGASPQPAAPFVPHGPPAPVFSETDPWEASPPDAPPSTDPAGTGSGPKRLAPTSMSAKDAADVARAVMDTPPSTSPGHAVETPPPAQPTEITGFNEEESGTKVGYPTVNFFPSRPMVATEIGARGHHGTTLALLRRLLSTPRWFVAGSSSARLFEVGGEVSMHLFSDEAALDEHRHRIGLRDEVFELSGDRFAELLRDDISALLINPFGVDEVQLRRHQFGHLRDLAMALALEPFLLEQGPARVGAEEARRFAGYRRVRFEGGQGVWPEVISLTEERPALPVFLTDDAVRAFVEHYRETTAHHPLEIATESAPDLVMRARTLGVDAVVIIGLGVVKEWTIPAFLALLGASS